MTDLPEEIYIGVTDGLWPIEAWTNEGHATYWAGKQGQEGRRRHVFKVRLADIREMEYVPPGEARLAFKDGRA